MNDILIPIKTPIVPLLMVALGGMAMGTGIGMLGQYFVKIVPASAAIAGEVIKSV